jgi:hypothetical protein
MKFPNWKIFLLRTGLILLPLMMPLVLSAQAPWQQITVPSLREAAANFRTPPREYGAIHWAIWGGELTRERIVQEFDTLVTNGLLVVNLGPARGMNPKYLSSEHLALTKFAVEEASKRGMKVWLADEGSYPSGFAGGKISADYPQLCMQGIVADMRISLAPGQTISMPAPPDTLGALVASPAAGTSQPLTIHSGEIKFTAPPEGRCEIVLVRHVFRSSPTRYINRADGTYSKDSLYSLIDYLNPEATRAYLKTTHEVYKELFGNEFGKTVLGFFGDEPDFTGFIPWTPALLEKFKEQKGYDLQPYLPLFFAPKLTDEARRARADYWDVWSSIFRGSFFGIQADWCAKNNLEYLVHLNHEELMLNLARGEDLIRNEGDFFRDMRHVQVPGIDNLSQLLPELVNREDSTYATNNNFPKLASSAAHLYGRPKAWTEAGGGLGVAGKFQLDYQLVRGMNAVQIQGALRRGGSGGGNAAANSGPPPALPMLAWYTNRAGYLMSIGRPAAQVALYHPANSMWLGDEEADRSTTKLSKQLLEHQIDFDYIDEQALSSEALLENGGFINLSGQVYRAVLVPSSTVITQASLDRLRKFAVTGGKVIFSGRTPTMVVDRDFLHAGSAPDLSFAALEASGDISAAVIQALPKPDVALDQPCAPIKYTHRTWRDADLYFFFNESSEKQARTALVAGRGQPQVWDAGTGLIHPMKTAAAATEGVRLQLVLEPYEAKFIVIGPMPPDVSTPEPSLSAADTLVELTGDWSLSIDDKSLTTSLKSWQDLGITGSGPATYTKEFTLIAKPMNKRLFIECADVRDYARVQLNGVDLQARAWQPYRWDVTGAVRSGKNILEIEVRASPAGRGPAPVPANPGPPGAPGGGGANSRTSAAVAGQSPGPVTPPVSGLLGSVRLVARD